MAEVFIIPTRPGIPQTFSIAFGSQVYQLRFLYINSPDPGWIMDIGDPVTDTPLVCGIPLVTGHNLLEQYDYIGVPGRMYVATEGDLETPPTFGNFGVTSHLYFIPSA